MSNFTQRLKGMKCEAVDAIEYEEPAAADTIYSVGTSIHFTDSTKLTAQFWRLTKEGSPFVSIFDHRQRYGLPAQVDTFRMMRDELVGKEVLDAVRLPFLAVVEHARHRPFEVLWHLVTNDPNAVPVLTFRRSVRWQAHGLVKAEATAKTVTFSCDRIYASC